MAFSGCQYNLKPSVTDRQPKDNAPVISSVDPFKTYWLEYRIKADITPPWVKEKSKEVKIYDLTDISAYYRTLFCSGESMENTSSISEEQPSSSTSIMQEPMILQKDRGRVPFFRSQPPKDNFAPKEKSDACEFNIIQDFKKIKNIKTNTVIFQIKVNGYFVPFFEQNGWELLGQSIEGNISDKPERQPAFEKTVTLKLNEQKIISPFTITPVKVLEDSRCPIKTRCAYSGQVTLQLKVEKNAYSSGSIQNAPLKKYLAEIVPFELFGSQQQAPLYAPAAPRESFQPKMEPIKPEILKKPPQMPVPPLPPPNRVVFLTLSNNPPPVYHDGYYFKILMVKPDRSRDREIQEQDYVFTIQIQSYDKNIEDDNDVEIDDDTNDETADDTTVTTPDDNKPETKTPKKVAEMYKPFLPKSNGILFISGGLMSSGARVTIDFNKKSIRYATNPGDNKSVLEPNLKETEIPLATSDIEKFQKVANEIFSTPEENYTNFPPIADFDVILIIVKDGKIKEIESFGPPKKEAAELYDKVWKMIQAE